MKIQRDGPKPNRRREAERGAGLVRPVVNAVGAAKGKVGLKATGGVLGVIASANAIDSFGKADGEGKVAASATVSSTAVQLGGFVAKEGTFLRGASKVATPGFTAIAQSATAVDEARKGQVYNAATSSVIAAGAALAAVPGLQLPGAALAATGVALKLGKWLKNKLF